MREQRYVIEKVLGKGFWDAAELLDLEGVREALRDLIQFLDRTDTKIYYTDFTDNITSLKEGASIHISNDLKNYKKKVEYYLKEHQDNLAVYKLRHNKRLNNSDMKELGEDSVE